MAPSIVNSSAGTWSTVSSVTPTAPAGARAGDVLVVVLFLEAATPTMGGAAPTRSIAWSSEAWWHHVWVVPFDRLAAVTWGGAAVSADWQVTAVRGALATGVMTSAEWDFGTSAEAPSLTTTVDGCLLHFSATSDAPRTATPPTGYTELSEDEAVYVAAAATIQARAGATGPVAATYGSATGWTAVLVALAPELATTIARTIAPASGRAVGVAAGMPAKVAAAAGRAPAAAGAAPIAAAGANGRAPAAASTVPRASTAASSASPGASAILSRGGALALGTPIASERSTGAPWRLRVLERPPLRTHITGMTPRGKLFRWGRDERDGANVPNGLQYGDTMPGGFDRCSVTLPRLPGVDYSDLDRGSTLTVRGAGGEVLGEYRLERAPQASGEAMSISPDAAGWMVHLTDTRSVGPFIFIDRDLGRWTGPSAQRRLTLDAAGVPHQNDPTAAWSETAAALQLAIQGAWTSSRPIVEAWYDAGPGAKIARILGTFAGWGDATFALYAYVCADEATSALEGSGDVYTAASGSFNFQPTARHRYGMLQWMYPTAPAGSDGSQYSVKITGLAVIGDHGLALYGAGTEAGFLASDMIAWLLPRVAPKLRFSTGPNGTIRPSALPLPQAAFHDSGTGAAIIDELTKPERLDWAVWEGDDGPTYYLNAPGARGRRWRARVGPSGLQETGQALDRVWNGVTIVYQDVDGSTRSVGPPGSGAHVETVEMLDLDPSNPANELGIRRWETFTMGGRSTPALARWVGREFLAQARQLDQSGQAYADGWIEDERGVLWPAAMARSGDTIEFVDARDPSARRVVKTGKDDRTKRCTFDLDAPVESLDALMAWLNLAAAPYGV